MLSSYYITVLACHPERSDGSVAPISMRSLFLLYHARGEILSPITLVFDASSLFNLLKAYSDDFPETREFLPAGAGKYELPIVILSVSEGSP